MQSAHRGAPVIAPVRLLSCIPCGKVGREMNRRGMPPAGKLDVLSSLVKDEAEAVAVKSKKTARHMNF